MAVVTSLQKDEKILNYLTLPGPLCAIMLFLYGYWYKKQKQVLILKACPVYGIICHITYCELMLVLSITHLMAFAKIFAMLSCLTLLLSLV